MPTPIDLFRLIEEDTGASVPDSETHARRPQALANVAEQSLAVSQSERLVAQRWDDDSREWIHTSVHFE